MNGGNLEEDIVHPWKRDNKMKQGNNSDYIGIVEDFTGAKPKV